MREMTGLRSVGEAGEEDKEGEVESKLEDYGEGKHVEDCGLTSQCSHTEQTEPSLYSSSSSSSEKDDGDILG